MADDKWLSVSLNAQDIANAMGQDYQEVYNKLVLEIQKLSINTRDFIDNYVKKNLEGWQRDYYLGEDGQNVRWAKVGDGLWVVEVDPSVAFLEFGSPKTFMEWLLNSPNAKRNKKGERYAVIPMTQARFRGGSVSNNKPILDTMIRNAMKKEGVSLKKIDYNEDGSPKLGIVKKLDIQMPFTQEQVPELFSKPRTYEESLMTGLPQHGGHFFLKGLTITQRKVGNKIFREATTFRVIHENHKQEGRWFRKEIKGVNAIDAAYRWAESQIDVIIKSIDESFKQ